MNAVLTQSLLSLYWFTVRDLSARLFMVTWVQKQEKCVAPLRVSWSEVVDWPTVVITTFMRCQMHKAYTNAVKQEKSVLISL